MPSIKPFRQVDENDAINGFFGWLDVTPTLAGTFVKINSGWFADQYSSLLNNFADNIPGGAGAMDSERWGVPAKVVKCAATGDKAIGILTYDVRETDENGEKLISHPRKADENNWIISGRAVNIATKGLFIYSGVNGGNLPVVGVTVGANAFLGTDGGINTSGSTTNADVTKVGKFLGVPDANGWVLFKLEL